MAPILPRFLRSQQAIEDARKLGRILLEVDVAPEVDARSTPATRSASGHDHARMRGLPLITRGVSGRDSAGDVAPRRALAEGTDETTAVAERVGPSVDVRCGGCGDVFALSVRHEYECRRKGRTPTCRTCRRPEKPMTPAERERFTRWWIEESGLSARELHEIAVGLGVSG